MTTEQDEQAHCERVADRLDLDLRLAWRIQIIASERAAVRSECAAEIERLKAAYQALVDQEVGQATDCAAHERVAREAADKAGYARGRADERKSWQDAGDRVDAEMQTEREKRLELRGSDPLRYTKLSAQLANLRPEVKRLLDERIEQAYEDGLAAAETAVTSAHEAADAATENYDKLQRKHDAPVAAARAVWPASTEAAVRAHDELRALLSAEPPKVESKGESSQ